MQNEEHMDILLYQEEIGHSLRQLEEDIAYLQDQYLQNTAKSGNLISGFDNYLAVKRKSSKKKGAAPQVHHSLRIFSFSSLSSPVQPEQESHPSQFQKQLPSRLTRNTVRKLQDLKRKEQNKNYDFDSWEQSIEESQSEEKEEEHEKEWSVSRSFNRFGSLHRNHKPIKQAFFKYHSDANSKRTQSVGSHFYSDKTDQLNHFGMNSLKKRREYSQNLSAPTRRKKRKMSKSIQRSQISQNPEKKELDPYELAFQNQNLHDFYHRQQRKEEQESDIPQNSFPNSSFAFPEEQNPSQSSQDSVDVLIDIVQKNRQN